MTHLKQRCDRGSELKESISAESKHYRECVSLLLWIGKTTLIQKAIEALKSSGVTIDGFYTQEVRESGRRIGFDVVTLSGRRGALSRLGSDSSSTKREYRVGQYVVDLVSFEQLVLPVLRNVDLDGDTEKKVCIIDEIGKMELFSQSFIQAVRQILTSSRTTILGTIPIPKGKPLGLVEEIRSRKDVKVFNVTRENRDNILQDIVTTVQNCRK
nr:cancer-related nucleoside-triphosphatase [Pelodiscus sinensis]|eukprot:XP_006122141.1 cancer-related nucleoside-triphosphatase [Pelodiscus sinensis]